MKNPNRYGTITKLSGNRRKPWVVKEGQSGRQKPIGYCATREEALMLLANYNHLPWNIDNGQLTLEELYKGWLKAPHPSLSEKSFKYVASYWRCIEFLGDYKYIQIKQYQKQATIDNYSQNYATQASIKNLWHHLEIFASSLEIPTIASASNLTVKPTAPRERRPFSDSEVQRLWQVQNQPLIDIILFMLYTGYRIGEVLQIRLDNINQEEWTIKGGLKTRAGKNRIVPVHSAILPLVKKHIAASTGGFLFEENGAPLLSSTFHKRWHKIMAALGMKHIPHETRHTVRTKLDAQNANRVCIDRILGHASEGIGANVYTHKSIEELRETIELINYEC